MNLTCGVTHACVLFVSHCFVTVIFRLWDVATMSEIKKVDLPSSPGIVELSADGSIISVPCGKSASFWDAET